MFYFLLSEAFKTGKDVGLHTELSLSANYAYYFQINGVDTVRTTPSKPSINTTEETLQKLRLRQEVYSMNLEHLTVPEGKEVLKESHSHKHKGANFRALKDQRPLITSLHNGMRLHARVNSIMWYPALSPPGSWLGSHRPSSVKPLWGRTW